VAAAAASLAIPEEKIAADTQRPNEKSGVNAVFFTSMKLLNYFPNGAE